MKKYKLITVVGARPQIIKSSAFSRVVKNSYSSQIEEILVHTGQHYDYGMSDLFFKELKLDKPLYNLGVGGISDSEQIAKMLTGLEEVFQKEEPNAVLVYGDTNSTLAGALASSKCGIPLIHIEAGLRSFDKNMPEETNRIVTDHLSTLLFAPTSIAVQNLQNEGIRHSTNVKAGVNNPHVFHCGDVMYDNALYFAQISEQQSEILNQLNLLPENFILATIHRKENVESAENLDQIIQGMLLIANDFSKSVVWPMHPRTMQAIKQKLGEVYLAEIIKNGKIKIIDPIGYLDMIQLQKHSIMIITDSGGLQKESFFFQKPCLVLRNQTEWVELVNNGNSVLCEAKSSLMLEKASSILTSNSRSYPQYYGDGEAASFICRTIINEF